MSPPTAKNKNQSRLLSQVSCPHCWAIFPPEQVLWIAEHASMLGDSKLGPEQARRFLPSRFNVAGEAIDASGQACRSLACPFCHLAIPRSVLEIEPLFLSVLGAPASGKSFYLSSLTWTLRNLLPHTFRVSFTDADPGYNRALNASEESLFLNAQGDQLTPLGGLIRKTELQGELYSTVLSGGHVVNYVRPSLFIVRPQAGHRMAHETGSLTRSIALYDNAGEHFEPGQDTSTQPVTRHLAHSRALFFLYDPTQDPRFRVAEKGGRPAAGGRFGRQETILNEAAARIRKHTQLRPTDQIDRPLLVLLSKCDTWLHRVRAAGFDAPYLHSPGDPVPGLDQDAILRVSESLRTMLLDVGPEVVAAAEEFSSDVIYFPVSALGSKLETDPKTGLTSIRPTSIEPQGVAVPMLYALARTVPGLVSRLGRRPRPADQPSAGQRSGATARA